MTHTAKKWITLVIVSMALLLIVVDMTVLYTALPTLTHDLGASASAKLWIINAYTVVVSGLLLGMGALGDRVGYRRMFIAGLAVFGVASLCAAYAPTSGALIAARALLGVGASMSVSIVVNGRLWGLLACHHMGPKRVPYSIRMAADVLAQVMASTIQGLESREEAELVERAAKVRTSLVESLLLEEDPLEALIEHADGMLVAARAQAMIATQFDRVVCRGIDQALGEAIVATLPDDAHELLVRQCAADWPDTARAGLGKWAGMLGLPYDPPSKGWCLLLRHEQIEEVAWGGKPDKSGKYGPMGERLTPRGSFDAWHQTVRGCAHDWEDGVLTHARMTLGELARVSNARRAQTEATRAQLLAMLGHDLRDPLHSINMAGIVLEKTDSASKGGTLGRRIQSSSNRM